jgi:type II secretory pathway predicted ATPase ExeA
VPDLTELQLSWKTEDDTRQFAARLARQLSTLTPQDSLFIELHGDLGAGKTTFVRHLLQEMGVTGRIKSPTYAIVEAYDINHESSKNNVCPSISTASTTRRSGKKPVSETSLQAQVSSSQNGQKKPQPNYHLLILL